MRRLSSLTFLALALIPLIAACGSDSTGPEDNLPPVTLVAADRDGDIYTINETTGAETLIITTTTQNSTGAMVDVGVVSSMLWVPSTESWWIGTGGRTAECQGCIQTLDPATGVATTLKADASFSSGVSGLSIHPTTGVIYSFQSDGTNDMYEVNPTTGVFSVLHSGLNMNNGGTGTTFTSDGTIYVAPRGELYTVNIATGTPTLIGAMTYTGFPTFTETSQTIGSMATRPSDGVVFGILKDGGNIGTLQPTFLVTVNLTTAEITNVGQHSELMDGLAFVPTTLLP
jgi:hypothetical protein